MLGEGKEVVVTVPGGVTVPILGLNHRDAWLF